MELKDKVIIIAIILGFSFGCMFLSMAYTDDINKELFEEISTLQSQLDSCCGGR